MSNSFLRNLAAVSVCLIGFGAQAEPVLTVGVIDGDTASMLRPNKTQVRCRLAGIDAPEKNQAFGQASKKSLSDLIYQKQVDISIVDVDKYGRQVCLISVDGLDVNREQIARGLAWVYRYCSRNDKATETCRKQVDKRFPGYDAAERFAAHNRLGLWLNPNPVPPWDFRKMKTNLEK